VAKDGLPDCRKLIFRLNRQEESDLPELKTYDIFISHAWKYNEDYYRLTNLLADTSNFKSRNYSVPEHDPAIDPNSEAGKEKLKAALKRQIKPVNCVLIISGMYVNYRNWIQEEIDIALKYNKPIIGLVPWGQERTPLAVQNIAKVMVGWSTDSIVAAIRKYSL
jgi:hypothetical protein